MVSLVMKLEINKIKINLIDLDNTLLPYDSFRKYVYLFPGNIFVSIMTLLWGFLRRLRIIDSFLFKKYVIINHRKAKNYRKLMRHYSISLIKDMRSSILKHIQNYSNGDHTINVLCSASPEDYIRLIAEELNWEFLATSLDSKTKEYIHMYGEIKIIHLMKKYPPEKFIYQYAISDSLSDAQLLTFFIESDGEEFISKVNK